MVDGRTYFLMAVSLWSKALLGGLSIGFFFLNAISDLKGVDRVVVFQLPLEDRYLFRSIIPLLLNSLL